MSNEKYRYVRPLGRGGMSEVFLVEDRRLGKRWALKRVKKEQNGISGQFLKEALLMKEWNHPFLPRITEVWDDAVYIYIVMDIVEGCTLKELMRRDGLPDEAQVLIWAKQLTEVLIYLHKQTPPVIYRDMKPDNIMITKEGYVKLIDFGISRNYHHGKSEDTGCLGTRGYAAPEQYGGRGQSDFRTDIYSLGVVLYEMLSGRNLSEPPYEVLPVEKWGRSLSAEFQEIVCKCVRTDPQKRYQNCVELKRALEQVKLKGKKPHRDWKRLAGAMLYGAGLLVTFVLGYIFGSF